MLAAALVGMAGGGLACHRDSSPGPTGPTVYPLQISAVAPLVGATEERTTVVVSGSGFEPGARVTFDGALAETVSQTAYSISVMTPTVGVAGAVPVAVTNPNGETVTFPLRFTFAELGLTGIESAAGIPTMMTKMKMAVLPAGARVAFGEVETIVSVSPTLGIWARVPVQPEGAPNVVDVTIIRADGRRTTLPSAFTYLPVVITPSVQTLTAGSVFSVQLINPVNWYNDFFYDLLGLYRVGSPATSAPVWDMEVWTDRETGTLAAPPEPGDYEFRFLVDQRTVVIGKSAVIRVTPR